MVQDPVIMRLWLDIIDNTSIWEMGLVLPSVGGIVSSHMTRTITTWGWTPRKHKNTVGCLVIEEMGIMTHVS